jgi:enterochelin esterase-like enzyme
MTNFRKIVPLLFVPLILLSCSPASTAAPEPTAILTAPTLTIKNTPAMTQEATKISPASPQSCSEQGSVERYQIESKALNAPMFIRIYLPPCYDAARAEGYPVLYLLHGQTFDERMWIDLGAADIADRLILSGDSSPFLMVMPNEEFYYRGVDDNQFPSALIDDVIPWVETGFNVCHDMPCRALGGISRGASWAERIGFTEPGVFSSIGAHSLPTFPGDISNLPDWLEKIPDKEMPRIYLDTGRFDPEVKAAYRFENVLNEKGILHEWHLNDGRHNEEYWKAHVEEYLRWYARGWENGG